MEVIDNGHIYRLVQLGTDETVDLKFIKRSGGAVTYAEEWPGLQTQEVLRALIHRTEYLDGIIECTESKDAAWHLRMALFLYEARAYRRKQEELNREKPEHDDTERPRPWRSRPFADVPFSEIDIEKWPIGADGHVITGPNTPVNTDKKSDYDETVHYFTAEDEPHRIPTKIELTVDCPWCNAPKSQPCVVRGLARPTYKGPHRARVTKYNKERK